mmetsp:Transcript_17682/g.38979  ORF Transcript_17682/g.38979 Transcript_17682/m.38979 type:complete len:113 (+) Transcript_17682:413-751(+)
MSSRVLLEPCVDPCADGPGLSTSFLGFVGSCKGGTSHVASLGLLSGALGGSGRPCLDVGEARGQEEERPPSMWAGGSRSKSSLNELQKGRAIATTCKAERLRQRRPPRSRGF